MTDQENDPILDAISTIMPPLLRALDALGFIGRHLHPPRLGEVLEAVGPVDIPLREQMKGFQAIDWPDHLTEFKDRVETACDAVCRAFEGLEQAKDDPNGIMKAYRALGENARATEALYPLAHMFQPVSRFFLDATTRDDDDLVKKISAADAARDNVGIMHANNEKADRGGFSLYVPEYYDPDKAWPVIVAMHGGSGHGRSFLWTWLREARGRGAIVISPSSIDSTWSLTGNDQDTANIERMLGFVAEEWNVDEDKLLLTGMSDGGTFSYVSGLQDTSPFTHLAPISSSFHPMLLEFVEDNRLKDLPVYITHGALDWMFPLEIAESAAQAFKDKGASVVYRPIDDLSHTYPREENARIMDWFLN